MRHRMLGLGALLGVGLLLLAPAVSEAQVRVGVGVGVQRGNVGIYYGNAPGYRGYYPGYGYPGYGYGYPYYGRSGVSISIGANPYAYGGYGYAPYYGNRYYTPYVPSYGYDPYYYGSAATYVVQPQVRVLSPAVPPMSRVDNTAHLEVRVPAEAKVWFGDQEMRMTGPVRRFFSPELEPGHNYNYDIRATWTENGQPVTQERKVTVQAGGRYQVDLTGDALPTPKTIQP